MSDTDELIIYTDGGSRGNPGPAAYAYVLQRRGEPDIEEKAFLGHTTNNVAEYTGLVKALEHARHLGVARVTVYSDSELMVKQMNGEYRVKNAGLLPLYEEAVRLRKGFAYAAIRHVRRELNKQADGLCNEAMDHPAENQPLPMPLAPREPVTVAPAPAEKPASTGDDVRLRAIEVLSACARQWARGDPESPRPAVVWDELWRLLVEKKAVRLRRKAKAPDDS
jgi:ribonuclease HI